MNFGIMTGDAETRVLVRTGALPTSREAVASVRCSILQSGVIGDLGRRGNFRRLPVCGAVGTSV